MKPRQPPIPERCPACNRKLVSVSDGLVCKNWKCEMYWKMGSGPVWRGQTRCWMEQVWITYEIRGKRLKKQYRKEDSE